MRVGLTGGVGAGKSTVARMLADHGAIVIDADAIARDVVRAGTPGFDEVVARFGDGVVGPTGELDRPALGHLVFADSAARRDLEAIVHPRVAERNAELTAAAQPDDVVVYDVPLLVENDLAPGFDLVVVVEAMEQVRLDRLAERGLSPDEARARMVAQASDAQREAVADEIVRNNGTLEALRQRVDLLWRDLRADAAV